MNNTYIIMAINVVSSYFKIDLIEKNINQYDLLKITNKDKKNIFLQIFKETKNNFMNDCGDMIKSFSNKEQEIIFNHINYEKQKQEINRIIELKKQIKEKNG